MSANAVPAPARKDDGLSNPQVQGQSVQRRDSTWSTEEIRRQFFTSEPNDKDEFISFLTEILNVVYEEFILQDSCFSGKAPTQLKSLFSNKTNADSNHQDSLIGILREVVQNSVNLANSKSLAYMSSVPLKLSVAADMAASILNQSLDTWDQAPAATEVEKCLIKLISEFAGISVSDGWTTPGGTLSNFQAIVLARDRALGELPSINDPFADRHTALSRLRAFCSIDAHFSVAKGLHLAGFADDALVQIKTTDEGIMDIGCLKVAIEAEIKSGNIPFLFVGTAGTTNAGAIDDLFQVGQLAKDNNSWFHVDAAHGGACLLSDLYRPQLRGVELATSISIDGHKFLYQSISCGILLLSGEAEPSPLFQTAKLPYLNTSRVLFEEAYDSYHQTVLTTRKFDALKLYLSLRFLGVGFFAQLIESRIQLAKEFWTILSFETDFQPAMEPSLNIVLFRYKPTDVREDLLDRLNTGIWRDMFLSGNGLLSLTEYEGAVFLRMIIMNPLTTQEDLQAIIRWIRRSKKNVVRKEEAQCPLRATNSR